MFVGSHALMDKIPIALGADQGYFPGLLATVFTTLASSANPTQFEFHIFDGGIDCNSKRKLEQLIADFGNANLVDWIVAEPEQFGELVSMCGNHLEYARLLLPRVLQRDRIIWLDADLLVFRDCAELWDYECGGLPIAAAHEDARFDSDVSNLDVLGISVGAAYFNTGVMVMNLASLRESRFADSALSYLRKHDGFYRFHDQSAINVVMHEKIAELPQEFNYFNRLYNKAATAEKVIEGGYNYHFLERPKPWMRYSGEPHAQIFYGIMQLLDEPMPRLTAFGNRLNWLRWKFPNVAAAYYRWTPKRLVMPREMQMCEQTWQHSTAISHVTKTGCADVKLRELRAVYLSRNQSKKLREEALA